VKQASLLVATFWSFTMAFTAAAYAEERVLTPNELNAHPDRYDGQAVRVPGWLSLQFEDYGLWGSKKAHDTRRTSAPPWPPSCVSVDSYVAGKVEKLVSRPAVVKGIFRKQFFHPGTISNGACNVTGLEVTKITE